MSFEIGHAPKGVRMVSVTQRPNARKALGIVLALQASDEEIGHIKAPTGYEIGIDEFRPLAKREGRQGSYRPTVDPS